MNKARRDEDSVTTSTGGEPESVEAWVNRAVGALDRAGQAVDSLGTLVAEVTPQGVPAELPGALAGLTMKLGAELLHASSALQRAQALGTEPPRRRRPARQSARGIVAKKARKAS